MSLTGKVAIVTGGSQGIGEGIARQLAQRGAKVAVLASASVDKARGVASSITELGGIAKPYACDIRDSAACRDFVSSVIADFGRVDILVNSAGVFRPTPVGETSDEDFAVQFDINVKGTWNMISAVTAQMKAQHYGKVVNISSADGTVGNPGYTVYGATKAAVIIMTRGLACELGPHGINVNCVAPGNTATPMNEHIRTQPEYKEYLEKMANRTPSRRTYSSVDDIANIVCFLASDDARAMLGATVLADEGISAGM